MDENHLLRKFKFYYFTYIPKKPYGLIDLIKWEEVQCLSLESQNIISFQTNKQKIPGVVNIIGCSHK